MVNTFKKNGKQTFGFKPMKAFDSKKLFEKYHFKVICLWIMISVVVLPNLNLRSITVSNVSQIVIFLLQILLPAWLTHSRFSKTLPHIEINFTAG